MLTWSITCQNNRRVLTRSSVFPARTGCDVENPVEKTSLKTEETAVCAVGSWAKLCVRLARCASSNSVECRRKHHLSDVKTWIQLNRPEIFYSLWSVIYVFIVYRSVWPKSPILADKFAARVCIDTSDTYLTNPRTFIHTYTSVIPSQFLFP